MKGSGAEVMVKMNGWKTEYVNWRANKNQSVKFRPKCGVV
jgi:hypothetical protein